VPDLVVYVDVDDTLVRTAGVKRIPVPAVIEHVRELSRAGAELYLWSRGGAEYARRTADELGIAGCFRAFLPKPNVVIDDEAFSAWRQTVEIHPLTCRDLTVKAYRDKLRGDS
jgi:predicted HAD superfamily phosphohydrolase YqeG